MSRRILPTLALAVLALACGDEGDFTVSPPSDFELTFEDDFEGAEGASPDPTKWDFDIGGDGWGNQELQFYTNRADNASLDGAGSLRIRARQESFGGREYTSARLVTQGLFEQRYGRFEARIKLPIGRGIWPAFWMLGGNIAEVDWPRCGEIDIMEFRGQNPNEVLGTVHGRGYSGGASISGSLVREDGPGFDEDFHVYAVEWDPGRIVWTVDGERYHTVSTAGVRERGDWVFDHPFFLLLNVAVGGTFLGNPDATTPFPAEMLVDYVRVYQRAQ